MSYEHLNGKIIGIKVEFPSDCRLKKGIQLTIQIGRNQAYAGTVTKILEKDETVITSVDLAVPVPLGFYLGPPKAQPET